jgi:hypothetical protein
MPDASLHCKRTTVEAGGTGTEELLAYDDGANVTNHSNHRSRSSLFAATTDPLDEAFNARSCSKPYVRGLDTHQLKRKSRTG